MEKNTKVLIAGATGTLGMPLVRSLAARGYEVVGLTRIPGKQAQLEQAGAAAVVANVLVPLDVEKALQTVAPDWVVHLFTAKPKNGPVRYSDMTATNTLRTRGTENLLRASITAGAKHIIGESMIFAYGFGDLGERAKGEGCSQ